MKNAFYFTSKSLFVLKEFRFLPWLCGHVSKRLTKKIKINFKFYDVTAWVTNNCNTDISQYFQFVFYIWISTKKIGIRFFWKKFLHKCLFKIPLWREIGNITSYFFISSKHLKANYLSFYWFNDSQTRGFELVTRGFELVTGGFELVTRGFELATRGFELVTRGF